MNKNLYILVAMLLINNIAASNTEYRNWEAEKENFDTLCRQLGQFFTTEQIPVHQTAELIRKSILSGASPVYYDLETNETFLLSDTFNCAHLAQPQDIAVCNALKQFVHRVEEITFAQRRAELNLPN